MANAVVTKAERRVMAALADGAWHSESELRTTFELLQRLYLRQLVEGTMTKVGATPSDRLWRTKLEPSLDRSVLAAVWDAYLAWDLRRKARGL